MIHVMQLICTHDPADPNHLICETKMPWKHRVLEIGLGGLVVALLVVSVGLFVGQRNGPRGVATGSPASQLQGSSFGPTALRVGPADTPNAARQDSQQPRPIEPYHTTILGEEESESPLYSGQIEPILEAEALYFTKEGEQVGRGAWPPEVGETTKLKVFLKIYGGPSSGLPEDGPQDIVVIGKLGKGMEWTGFAPQGQGLSYEPAIRTVRWQVRCQVSPHQSKIGAGQAGVRCEQIVVFEVEITPILNQIQEKQFSIVDNLALKYDNREILFPDIVISWD